MIVYANGCSFGMLAGHGTEKTCYAQIVAETLQAQLLNRHLAGSCNRRIIRRSLRDLIELRSQSQEKILALIGLSFFFRTELWQPNLPAEDNDGHFHPVDAFDVYRSGKTTKDREQTFVKDWYKQHLIWQSKESLITDQLTDIILFAYFCKQQGIDYLIWNNAEPWPGLPEVDTNDVFLKSLIEHANTQVNWIDPWQFAFLPWALHQGLKPYDADKLGDRGHPGPEAHRRLAEFLLTKIKEIT